VKIVPLDVGIGTRADDYLADLMRSLRGREQAGVIRLVRRQGK